MHNDIQEVLGQNYGVPDDIDEEDLLGELDALEADMALEAETTGASGAMPSYMQVRSHVLHMVHVVHMVHVMHVMHVTWPSNRKPVQPLAPCHPISRSAPTCHTWCT